jgi:hypothetical protein
VRSRNRDLSGKLGTRWGMGVVAWVLTVVASVLLSLLPLLLDVSLLSFCLCLMCLGGRRRLARLAEESREWGLMMLLSLVSLAFYPPAGVSCDTFLSVAELGHCRRAPTYCRSLGIPST